MYDLGETVTLRALQLTTYKYGVPPPEPPPPPFPPPPPPPPEPPPPPPSPPMPPAAPPPPFPFICIGSVGTADCYDKHVLMANNGKCALLHAKHVHPSPLHTLIQRCAQLRPCAGEDGGEGSVSSVCAWGTDYGDCPYRCDPGGDWYAVPSEYLVQARGQNDPQCAPSTTSDDASGRAVIAESHVDPPGTAIADMTTGDNCHAGQHCHTGCGCVSRWEIPNTAAGELLESASKIRYRAIFSGRGACYNVLGFHKWGATGGWSSNMAEASDFTIERSPIGSAPRDFASDYTHITFDSNNQPVENVWHQFSNCGAPGCDWRFWACDGTSTTPDHTSVYVNEHKRVDPSQPFDLATSNGVCGGYGSWRYEGLEVYVLPYARYAGIDCSGVTQSEDLNGGVAIPGTVEECARACANYEGPDGTCHGFAVYMSYGVQHCALKELASPYLEDVGGQCNANTNVDMYVYTGAPPPPPTGRRLEEQVASATTAEAVVADEGHRRLQTPAPVGHHKVLDGCWSDATPPSLPHHNNHAVWKHFDSRAETLAVVTMRTCEEPNWWEPTTRTYACEQAYDVLPGVAPEPAGQNQATIYHSGV